MGCCASKSPELLPWDADAKAAAAATKQPGVVTSQRSARASRILPEDAPALLALLESRDPIPDRRLHELVKVAVELTATSNAARETLGTPQCLKVLVRLLERGNTAAKTTAGEALANIAFCTYCHRSASHPAHFARLR